MVSGKAIDARGYFMILNDLMKMFPKRAETLKAIYDEYRAALNNSNGQVIGNKDEVAETFRQDVETAGVYVYFVWNINRWLTVKDDSEVVVEKVPYIYSLLTAETIENIDHKKALSLSEDVIDNPLLVAPWGLNDKEKLLIDGHHRILKKKLRDDSYVNVYYLTEDQSIDMMVSERYKNVYRIAISVIRLFNYLNSNRTDCPIYRFVDGDPSKSYKQNFV